MPTTASSSASPAKLPSKAVFNRREVVVLARRCSIVITLWIAWVGSTSATVARTADDLVRYHGKMMIVDGKELHLLAFNFTQIDTERSRSFGIMTKDKELVEEAVRFFDCDFKRRRYKPGSSRFLVSPLNAREELVRFIEGAKKELLIYDVKITDREMIKLLEARAKEGVEIRVIGKMARRSSQNWGSRRPASATSSSATSCR